MGTISDKLMRIINTKEDIRQALISKGYDVPTSIPFKEYAKMILDLPCKVDSFPDIEGIVARYSASGLTNEQMAANPLWVDKTGNGHDLQLKNFSWKGMSGVGGVSTYYDKYEFTPDKYYMVAVSSGTQHAQFTFKVTGLVDGNTLSLSDTSSPSNLYGKWTQDGIYTVDIDVINTDKSIYFYNGVSAIRGTFTIEILPLYPGALVFDGVDDYGVCENFPILTKEKGYTVVALRQWDQDFLNTTLTGGLLSTRNYSTGEGVAFEKIESSNKGYWNLGAGGIIDFAKSPFTWQTSKQYNNVGILKGDKNHGKPLCVGCGLSGGQQCGRFAIWELVFLDHDATEEELTKIKDYFVKTYPWLFPDQAWTVVGKTNEDEDRATIANITGNGNDLILSNFGFAEGSGYNEEGEYAGYLVTDGVDDAIQSSNFSMGKDFTVVGEWKMLKNSDTYELAGINKYDSFILYNYSYNNRINVYIHSGQGTPINTDSIKAFTSTGLIYIDNFNNVEEVIPRDKTDRGYTLFIGYNNNVFTKLAFKNLAIYSEVLSKEDCIKAYNYLQTLKAK